MMNKLDLHLKEKRILDGIVNVHNFHPTNVQIIVQISLQEAFDIMQTVQVVCPLAQPSQPEEGCGPSKLAPESRRAA